MDTKELLKKVRRIEIKTRGLSNQIFSGEYHSAFKGRGMTFSEVREYQPGDDIRQIDWNVTARFGHPYVKIFEEERELTLMLLVDLSASENFGSDEYLKRQFITEICAVLAFSAGQNNDKVGAILFSDRIEKFIPPKKGRSHILHIIRELLYFEPQSRQTDVGNALRYMTNAIKKRSIAFVLSDFISPAFDNALKIANRKHDVVGIHIYDRLETDFPDAGLVPLTDPETGSEVWVDTSSPEFREQYGKEASRFGKQLQTVFKKAGVDFASVSTGDSYVPALMQLFKQREVRR